MYPEARPDSLATVRADEKPHRDSIGRASLSNRLPRQAFVDDSVPTFDDPAAVHDHGYRHAVELSV